MCKRLLALLALCFSFSIPAETQDELTVLTESLAPYSFLDNGQPAGFSTEIVKEVLKQANMRGAIHVAVWEGAYQKALLEKNVLIYSMARTKEREDLFYWIGELAPTKVRLWKLTDRSDIQVNSIEQVPQYRLGVLSEGAGEIYIRSHPILSKVKRIHYRYTDQLFPLLLNNRIDLMAGVDMAIYAQLQKHGMQASEIQPVFSLLDKGLKLYLALSKPSSNEVYVKLKRAYQRVSDSGFIEKTRQRHFGNEGLTDP